MSAEIERKFLVTGDGWKTDNPTRYFQGYLSQDPERTVRIRIIPGKKAVLTIKGPMSGISRDEFEYDIPSSDAITLLSMSKNLIIEKNRHIVDHDGMTWEIDEFLGNNVGLVIAEIELESEDQEIDLPGWVGTEVTDDRRYYNSNLSQNPYTEW